MKVSIVSRFKATITKTNILSEPPQQEYYYSIKKVCPTLYEAFSEWLYEWMNKNSDLRLEIGSLQKHSKPIYKNGMGVVEDSYTLQVKVLNRSFDLEITFRKDDKEDCSGTFLG